MTLRPVANATIRVGLIGASPGRSWASTVHVPAIAATPEVALQAVATRHEESARAAAEQYRAPLWFDDAHAMIADPSVDAVVVAVKVPEHYAYAHHALMRGKPVLCEMPFTRTLTEARTLVELAREKAVATAIGVQGRFSPWIRQIRDIVASGELGRILSTTMIGYDELSTGTIDQANTYLLDVSNGANPLTIHAAHDLDGIRFAIGDIAEVTAVTATSRPSVIVRQTGETVVATSPDQIAVAGKLRQGAILSFHMRAGSGDPAIHWEIQGEKAALRITSKGYLMWRPLTIERWTVGSKRWEALSTPPPLGDGLDVPGVDGPAAFVASLYAAFAQDIRTGSSLSMTFAEALRLSETMAAISSNANDGRARSVTTGAAPGDETNP